MGAMTIQNMLILVGTVILLIVIIVGSIQLYRWHLDRAESWDPFATMIVVLPPGRHRLEEVTTPFRLPSWDTARRWRRTHAGRRWNR